MKKYCYRLVKYSISSSYLQGGKGNFCVVTGWGICTIFQAPLWGLSMNRPAPPRGFCSFPPPPKKKMTNARGGWARLELTEPLSGLVYIGTKISRDTDGTLLTFIIDHSFCLALISGNDEYIKLGQKSQ